MVPGRTDADGARGLISTLLLDADGVTSGGVPGYLATNQQQRRGAHMHQRMGYEKHVKGQFHSFRLGVAKPDPKFFTCIIEVLDVDPARTLFIDDLEENVRAAWSVGLIARRLDLESGTAGLEAILRDHALLRPKTTTDA